MASRGVYDFARRNGRAAFVRKPNAPDFSLRGLAAEQKMLAGSLARILGIAQPGRGGAESAEYALTDSWVVYACVQALAAAARSVPLRVWASAAADAEQVPEDHPVRRLLEQPLPGWSWSDLAGASIVHRKVTGEDWWMLMGQDGGPVTPLADHKAPIPLPAMVLPVAGDLVADERDKRTGRIVSVAYAGWSSSPPTFPVGSVLAFLDYNPREPQRGLSPLTAAARAIELGFQSERYQESVMRAGGPGAYVQYQDEMSSDEERRLQGEVNEGLRDPQLVGGLKVLSGKVNILPNPATPKEMLQRETLDWVRDVICSVLDVPPPLIGVYDSATYNNISEAHRRFWSAVRAHLEMVALKVNTCLLPRLTDSRLAAVRVGFDYTKIEALQRDDSKQFELAATLAASGAPLSFNEAAALLGLELEPPQHGDLVLVPGTMAPLEQIMEPPAPAPPPEPAKALERRALPNPPLSALERGAYMENFQRRVSDRPERLLRRAALAWFRDYEREQMRRLRRFAEAGEKGRRGGAVDKALTTAADIERFLLLVEEKWAAALAEAADGPIEVAFVSALHDMASELGMISLPSSHPDVVRALALQGHKLTEGVTSRLSGQIKETILAVLAGTGDDERPLQLQIRDKLPELTEHLRAIFGTKEARAATIARTEVAQAVGSARELQMKDAAIVEHQWISARDEHVRESHQELDGEIRTIGAEFKPGLRRPGDPNAEAAEIINCRCISKPLVPRPGAKE